MRGNSSAVPNSSAPSIDPTTGEVPNIQPAQSGVFNTPTPTLESQDVEVNKALTTETQSQALASNDIPDKQQPKKYNPRPDSSQDSALEFIAKHGGIDPSDQQANDLRVSIGAEPNKNVRIVGIRNLFAGKGKGMKLDAAAQLLWQHGYLDEHDSQALLNKLLDNGDYHGHEYDHAADYAAGQQEWSAQENESPVTTSADERKIVDAIVDSIDDDFFENIPFDLTSSHASAELEAWLNDDQGTNSQEAQRADASNETEAIGNDRARTTPPQNQTRENSEFTLSSETNAQILAREQAAQRQAEQARQRDSAPSADDFTLSGSKRDADVAAANGAQDLFDSTSTPTPPTNRTAGAITADGKAPLDQVLKMQGRTEFDASLEPVDEAQLSSLRNKNAAQHSTAQHSITQHNTTEFPASVGRQAKTAIPITPSEANTPEKNRRLW
ncbi:hypothetical protein [Deefgea sp. CFH1-16]|uniref:hypothetical protein n=1 Tax=Deefgea sp. CFH1-16 TaxID=2675457 RepID=UPI001FFDE661|nr:hypothetical protein [Deefgea sp. CFH1-16]